MTVTDIKTTSVVVILSLTLKMTTAQVVKTSITVDNSPIQQQTHPDDHIPLTHSWVQTIH